MKRGEPTYAARAPPRPSPSPPSSSTSHSMPSPSRVAAALSHCPSPPTPSFADVLCPQAAAGERPHSHGPTRPLRRDVLEERLRHTANPPCSPPADSVAHVSKLVDPVDTGRVHGSRQTYNQTALLHLLPACHPRAMAMALTGSCKACRRSRTRRLRRATSLRQPCLRPRLHLRTRDAPVAQLPSRSACTGRHTIIERLRPRN